MKRTRIVSLAFMFVAQLLFVLAGYAFLMFAAPSTANPCGGGYVLDGTVFVEGIGAVKRADPQNRTITLEHEAIPYVLKKGATTFIADDEVISHDLKAGDRISFTLKISEGKSVIVKINVLD